MTKKKRITERDFKMKCPEVCEQLDEKRIAIYTAFTNEVIEAVELLISLAEPVNQPRRNSALNG